MSERNLDFDAVIDRRGTKCLKYDFAVQRGARLMSCRFGSQIWTSRPPPTLRMR